MPRDSTSKARAKSSIGQLRCAACGRRHLERRLKRDEVTAAQLEALAVKLADFHTHAASEPQIEEHGRLATVARNARENFAKP